MLIPSIDLQGGKIVQLVQGERLAVETSDVDAWIQKFAAYPKVQLIDLDAAKGAGNNESLVARICRALPCRVGGGIRTIERAQAILALGARKVILGSSLFTGNLVNIHFARDLSDQIGPDRLIAAVDGKGGKVVVHGWRTSLEISPAEAIRMLEPFFSEFLYTHVDLEGLMKGTDMAAIRALRETTTRALTAAGGITTHEEIDLLDAMTVDAVVGMALYTGRLKV
ncbi:MAG TPA: HisA/HisF-related TIM barrel protein [Vicinamibacterales bacterium]|jgi:phosphoribosylformimino-5-aminoimidazole carboxamide ribotide isomerase|nr:HisA/HisF-related TIM barrel protein [Vicinamibacterales bacterium]